MSSEGVIQSNFLAPASSSSGPPGGLSNESHNVKETMLLLLDIFKKQLKVVSKKFTEYNQYTVKIDYRTEVILLGFEFDFATNAPAQNPNGRSANVKGYSVFRISDMYFIQTGNNSINETFMLCAGWDNGSLELDALNERISSLCKYFTGQWPTNGGWDPPNNLRTLLDEEKYNSKWGCYKLCNQFMDIYGTVPGKYYKFNNLQKYTTGFGIYLHQPHNACIGRRNDPMFLFVSIIDEDSILIKTGNIVIVCSPNSITTEVVAKLQKIFDYNCPENGWLSGLVLD